VETEEWYVTVNDRETRIDRVIYRPAYETAVAVLPKVRDEKLIREAEKVLEKANEAVEKAIGLSRHFGADFCGGCRRHL